tara:strand:- start:856 stop:1029 length:174 start_codon:yes stop_codon:yes gene_type:complete
MTNKQVEEIRKELVKDLKTSKNKLVLESIKDIKTIPTKEFKAFIEIVKKVKLKRAFK